MKKIFSILFTTLLVIISCSSVVFANEDDHINDLTTFPDDTYDYYYTDCPYTSSGFAMEYDFNVVTGNNNWNTTTTTSRKFNSDYYHELSYEEGMQKLRNVMANGSLYDGTSTHLDKNSYDIATSYRTYEYLAYNEASDLWYTSCHFSLFIGVRDNSPNTTSSGEGTGVDAYEGGFNSYESTSSNTSITVNSAHQLTFYNDAQTRIMRHHVYIPNTDQLDTPAFASYAGHRIYPTAVSDFYTSNSGYDRTTIQVIVDHTQKRVIIADPGTMLGISVKGIKTSGVYSSKIKFSVDDMFDPIFQEFTYDGYVYNQSGSTISGQSQTLKLLYSEQIASIVSPAYITSTQFKSSESSQHPATSVPFTLYSDYFLSNPCLAFYYDQDKVQHRNPFVSSDSSLYSATTLETSTMIDDDGDSSTSKVYYTTRTWRFAGTYINTNFMYLSDPAIALPGQPDIDDEEISEYIKGDVYGETCSLGLPEQKIYPRVLDLSSELGGLLKAAHAEVTNDDSTFLNDTDVLYFNMTNTLNGSTASGYIFFNNTCMYYDVDNGKLLLGGYWKGFSDIDVDESCRLFVATSVEGEYLQSSKFIEISYSAFFGHALPNGDGTNYGTMEFTSYPFDYYDTSGNKKIGTKYVSYLCHIYRDMPVKMIFYPIVYEDANSGIANYENGYSLAEFLWNNLRSKSEGEIDTNEFNNVGNETGSNKPYQIDDTYTPTSSQDFSGSVSQLINLHDQLDTYNSSINNYLNEYIGFFNSDFDLLSNTNFMSSATNTRDFIDDILGNQYIAPVLYVVLCIMLVIIALR